MQLALFIKKSRQFNNSYITSDIVLLTPRLSVSKTSKITATIAKNTFTSKLKFYFFQVEIHDMDIEGYDMLDDSVAVCKCTNDPHCATFDAQ